MNGILVIFGYTMMGVSDTEIATILNLNLAQVREIKESEAYRKAFEIVMYEFVNVNADVIQSRIAAMAHSALDVVAEVAVNGRNEANRVRSAIDLLDRAGTSHKDTVHNRDKMNMGSLRIVVTTPNAGVHVDVHLDKDDGLS